MSSSFVGSPLVMDDIVDESRPSEEMEIDPDKEAYYINDPKKALKTFFDREGTIACTAVQRKC